MLRGFYTAASGMFAQQRKTDMLTNNMANVNTPGYKADQAAIRAFPEMLLQRFDSGKETGRRGSQEIGSLNTGVYMQEMLANFAPGDLRETGRKTDIALSDIGAGAVFFTVEQNGETKYTRNGRFTVDGDGLLTTEGGLPVLDAAGNRITVDSDQFEVSPEGIITENGVQTARLGLAYTDEPMALSKEGNGLYGPAEGAPALQAAQGGTYSMTQGFLEGSNVDPSRSMTDMLTAYRAFEANQKILQAYDRSMDKAVNDVGRVNG